MNRRHLIAAAIGVAGVAPLAIGTAVDAVPRLLPVLTGPIRIMIGGHSIAAGVGSTVVVPGTGGIGYRLALGSWLTNVAGLSVSFVGSQVSGSQAPWMHHEGYGGYSVAQYATVIPGKLATYNPHILALHLGVNDAKAPLFRSAAQIYADYVTVLAAVFSQSPDIRVAVSREIPPNGSTVTSTPNEYARASVTVKKLNALLPGLIGIYGDQVRIVRNDILAPPMLADGLHPNDNGYLSIAYNFLNDPTGPWPWLSADPAPQTDSVLPFDPWRLNT